MRVVDTSALYALVVETDPHHAAAVKEVGRAEPMLLPSEILLETLGLLSHRFGPAAARATGKALRALPHLEVQPTPDDPWDDLQGIAWKAYESEARLSFADCIVLAWCRRRNLAPLSFDKRLVAAATS